MPKRERPRPATSDPPADNNPPPRAWKWFCNQPEGKPLARKELDDLPALAQARLTLRMERYIAGQSRRKDVKAFGRNLFEIRCRVDNNHYRVMFMLWGPHCVALTAFFKNQEATPPSDIERARKRAARWKETFGEHPSS